MMTLSRRKFKGFYLTVISAAAFLLCLFTTSSVRAQVDTTSWSDPRSHHTERARIIRQFLPDTGPDSMAVALPASHGKKKHAFCFDADKCRLRYAWTGDFIHLNFHKRDGPAKIKGSIFHRAEQSFPLRFGDRKLKTDRSDREFLGYQLRDRVPVFHYRVNEKNIRHQITQLKKRTGLKHHFRIKNVSQPVWFVFDNSKDITYRVSTGERTNGAVRLSPEEATEFSVVLIYQPKENK